MGPRAAASGRPGARRSADPGGRELLAGLLELGLVAEGADLDREAFELGGRSGDRSRFCAFSPGSCLAGTTFVGRRGARFRRFCCLGRCRRRRDLRASGRRQAAADLVLGRDRERGLPARSGAARSRGPSGRRRPRSSHDAMAPIESASRPRRRISLASEMALSRHVESARDPQRFRHGIERSEDDNSIIRARVPTRCIESGRRRSRTCACDLRGRFWQRISATLRGARRAFGLRRSDVPAIDATAHRVDDAADVLVAEHREYRERVLRKKPMSPRPVGERARRVRVVRDVEHDGRPPGKHLQAARRAHEREAALHLARATRERGRRSRRGRRAPRMRS